MHQQRLLQVFQYPVAKALHPDFDPTSISPLIRQGRAWQLASSLPPSHLKLLTLIIYFYCNIDQIDQRSRIGVLPGGMPVVLVEPMEFSDTEELSIAVRHANVRAMQISRGSFHADLRRMAVGDWHIQFLHFKEGSSACNGDACKDRHIFVVPLEATGGCRLLGEEVTNGSIGIYSPGAEHGCVTRAGLKECVVLPPLRLLEAAIERGDEIQLPRIGAEHRVGHDMGSYSLLRTLKRIEAAPLNLPVSGAVTRSIADNLETSLIAALSFDPGKTSAGRTPMPRREILKRISELLEGREGELVFASELARAAGISHPTLQRVFLEWFGVPPARYLMLHRLYLARKRLRSCEFATVSQVAESCGFLELSRFAKRYKALFGQLPSETLRGIRGAVG